MKATLEGIQNTNFNEVQIKQAVEGKKEVGWETRKNRIIINIFMAIFVILSFTIIEGVVMLHIIIGSVCTLLFAAHVLINKKWMVNMTKSYVKGKLSSKIKRKYIVNLALIAVWSVCIVAGFPAIGYYFGGIEGMQFASRLHYVTSRWGLLLIIVHIFQHWGQIKSYFKIRETDGSPKTSSNAQRKLAPQMLASKA